MARAGEHETVAEVTYVLECGAMVEINCPDDLVFGDLHGFTGVISSRTAKDAGNLLSVQLFTPASEPEPPQRLPQSILKVGI